MVLIDNNQQVVTNFNRGKAIFTTFCAACHGADKKGDASLGYPSLADIKTRLTADQVLAKIKAGGGKMPAFEPIIKGEEDAIIAFLFDDQSATAARRPGGITKNMHPLIDTLPRWMNATAYSNWNAAFKPPSSTLNAINLNTGDYEWKIVSERGSGGPTVTAGGLVFVNSGSFKAFDKDTGKMLWDSKIIGVANAASYMVKNKQYVTVSVGGTPDSPGAAFVTFELPDK
jgi:quinoprotein glucose dehydrogenase